MLTIISRALRQRNTSHNEKAHQQALAGLQMRS
jgi:hypothetical protein